jgi:4-amino-4-deoxy-L-arabinose transferase-like glycosyltransferase
LPDINSGPAARTADTTADAEAARATRSSRARRALFAIVLAGVLLNLWAIGWGLPNMPYTWAADEFSPLSVHNAIEKRFSNGWFELYPPMHVYVLALAQAPVEILAATGVVTFDDPRTYEIAFYLLRLVSVVMAAGIVGVVFLISRDLFDERSAVWSAAAAACVAPLVYYGKIANVDVPFVFWLLCSMRSYLKIVQTGAWRDYAVFAITAACAIGTKDQAYGFYLLVPVVIVLAEAAARRRAGNGRPVSAALLNGRMVGAGLLGLLVLALIHNLAFNAPAATERLRIITGDMTAGMQEFQNTPAGHLGLIALGIRHVRFSMGWPLFLIGVAGTALAVLRWRSDRRPLALLVPIVSYWLFLIVPILYNFDRYMLPVALIMAVYAGAPLARLAGPAGRLRPVRLALLIGVFGYSLAYATSINTLLDCDSRYEAERWMRANITSDKRLMAIGYSMYLPRLQDFTTMTSVRPTIEELDSQDPDYIVTTSLFDEWRFRQEPASTLFFQRLRAGRTRYAMAHRSKGTPRWNLISLRGVRSNLDKINPEIVIYQRIRPL